MPQQFKVKPEDLNDEDAVLIKALLKLMSIAESRKPINEQDKWLIEYYKQIL